MSKVSEKIKTILTVLGIVGGGILILWGLLAFKNVFFNWL